MDGVILSMPPSGRVDHWSQCRFSEMHIWRWRDEAESPALAGNDPHGRQVPLSGQEPLSALWTDLGLARAKISALTCLICSFAFRRRRTLKIPYTCLVLSGGEFRSSGEAFHGFVCFALQLDWGPWEGCLDAPGICLSRSFGVSRRLAEFSRTHSPREHASSLSLCVCRSVWARVRERGEWPFQEAHLLGTLAPMPVVSE